MSEFCNKFSTELESSIKKVQENPNLVSEYDNNVLAAILDNDDLFNIITNARIRHKLKKLENKF